MREGQLPDRARRGRGGLASLEPTGRARIPSATGGEAHRIQRGDALAEEERAEAEPEDRGQEVEGAHPAGLAVAEEPEPQPRAAEAEHEDQVSHAGDEAGGGDQPRRSLEEPRDGDEEEARHTELDRIGDHHVFPHREPLEDQRGRHQGHHAE
jgi:hypothetical protein